MDCYKCKYVKSIPGDTHKSCGHPSISNNNLVKLSIITSAVSVDGIHVTFTKAPFRVVGELYAFHKGWLTYPVNFDPIWIKRCGGYEKREND